MMLAAFKDNIAVKTYFNSTTFPTGACIVHVQFKLCKYLLIWMGDLMSDKSSVIKPPHDCTSYFNRKPFPKDYVGRTDHTSSDNFLINGKYNISDYFCKQFQKMPGFT